MDEARLEEIPQQVSAAIAAQAASPALLVTTSAVALQEEVIPTEHLSIEQEDKNTSEVAPVPPAKERTPPSRPVVPDTEKTVDAPVAPVPVENIPAAAKPASIETRVEVRTSHGESETEASAPTPISKSTSTPVQLPPVPVSVEEKSHTEVVEINGEADSSPASHGSKESTPVPSVVVSAAPPAGDEAPEAVLDASQDDGKCYIIMLGNDSSFIMFLCMIFILQTRKLNLGGFIMMFLCMIFFL